MVMEDVKVKNDMDTDLEQSVRELAEVNRRLKAGEPLTYSRIYNQSPLIWACSVIDEDFGIQLVREGKGVDVNEPWESGYTPLHMCAQWDMRDLAAVLIEKRANLEWRTMDMSDQICGVTPGGLTPLHVASQRGSTKLVELLLKAKSNPEAKDLDFNTPWDLGCGARTACLLGPEPTKQQIENQVEKRKQDRITAKRRFKEFTTNPPLRLRKFVTIKQLFSSNECETSLNGVLEKVKRIGWRTDRHTGYATTDMPSYKAEAVDEWVRVTLSKRLFPKIIKEYSLSKATRFGYRDLFFVKYEDASDVQSGLAPHRDSSVFSFNILLNHQSEFTGGGTYFVDEDETVRKEIGDCVVHSGRVLHMGTPIDSGRRYILVGFLDACDENGNL